MARYEHIYGPMKNTLPTGVNLCRWRMLDFLDYENCGQLSIAGSRPYQDVYPSLAQVKRNQWKEFFCAFC